MSKKPKEKLKAAATVAFHVVANKSNTQPTPQLNLLMPANLTTNSRNFYDHIFRRIHTLSQLSSLTLEDRRAREVLQFKPEENGRRYMRRWHQGAGGSA